MIFSADNLPEDLELNSTNGRISGSLNLPGEYQVTLRAKNSLGAAEKPFRIVVGEDIQLTPAMGWNSYNCFGERASTQDLALRAARAMVTLGLDQHGWTYVNMDDGWSARNAAGRFMRCKPIPRASPTSRRMVDEIHALGLKAGLYSTPWRKPTVAGSAAVRKIPMATGRRTAIPGGENIAKQLPSPSANIAFAYIDAKQFADWGFDYLKLDWGPVEAPETKEMHQALRVDCTATSC